MKKRMALLVYVDLDQTDGVFFSTTKSALHSVATILEDRIDHYNPIVSLAPMELQPPNYPHGPSVSQEIPVAGRPPEPLQTYVKRDEGGYNVVTTGEILIPPQMSEVDKEAIAASMSLVTDLTGELPPLISMYQEIPVVDPLTLTTADTLYNEGYFPA